MQSVILVTPGFDTVWPYAADHLRKLWQPEVQFIRAEDPLSVIRDVEQVARIAAFDVELTAGDLDRFPKLQEFASNRVSAPLRRAVDERKIRLYTQRSEGFWAESVSECAIGLTICGLRRIPQLHQQIQSHHKAWDYSPNQPDIPGTRGQQFGDDDRFTSGTVARKRVRIVGIGNIASHYSRIMSVLGADVAAYDPFAQDPCFRLSGARRVGYLADLMQDAEIFAPMVPLRDSTRGLITAEMIDALPQGCLVVMVTRAAVCDMPAIRRRVLNDELALAADVFDVEPLPLDDPLLGRHNVVHTPHLAGRTLHANQRYAEMLAEQFTRAESQATRLIPGSKSEE